MYCCYRCCKAGGFYGLAYDSFSVSLHLDKDQIEARRFIDEHENLKCSINFEDVARGLQFYEFHVEEDNEFENQFTNDANCDEQVETSSKNEMAYRDYLAIDYHVRLSQSNIWMMQVTIICFIKVRYTNVKYITNRENFMSPKK
jgi:hypothetical protein